MSNSAVGNVYQAIIDEVINTSRVDFEENGIEEAVLEELRQGWQQKLSQLDVASFPWDPKIEPPPAAPVSTTADSPSMPNHLQSSFSPHLAKSNVQKIEDSGSNGLAADAANVKQESDVTVKQEPGQQTKVLPPVYPGYNPMDNKNSVAANRAQAQLQAQYGNRAAGSINAIQDRIAQQPYTARQQGASSPNQKPTVQPQQGQSVAQGQQQQQQQEVQVPNGQTDGADDGDADFEGVLVQKVGSGHMQELGRVQIDRLLHDQIAAQAKAMEGGGLMLPLAKAPKNRSTGRKDTSQKPNGVSNFDGVDDGDDDLEDADEDAINSDLDDPDEGNEDDEAADEGLGHIMLCMYDKVQRVKNKWKCTLKDGVLTVNGKEYVFHKATGEYEW